MPWFGDSKDWRGRAADLAASCDGSGELRVDLQTAAEAEDFAAWLAKDASLQRLSLHLEDSRAFRHVFAALQSNYTLQSLRLRAECVAEREAYSLAEALRVNQTLRELSLRNNSIGERGAIYFAKALPHNRGLRILDLTRCGVGNEGARFLAEALRENRTLQELHLNANRIGAPGAQRLAEALSCNWALRRLRLADQGGSGSLRDESAGCFADALMKNRSLEELDLSMNHIGEEGLRKLARALQSNCTLQVLGYRSNVCLVDVEDVCRELNTQLAQNKPLPPAPPAPSSPLRRLKRRDSWSSTSCGSSPSPLSSLQGLSPCADEELQGRCRATGDWFGFDVSVELAESV
eukprot:TRINITY_DN2671_c2_g1_i1.p1 TRINITY_DN2671_c2_g1~~TRINITY_DN2671_c2_g1_i1.p1  ORF type:complete len:349 (-),score=77.21 TRINITY_DN2671_c2_g1_i1:138-1184(-)